MKTIRLRVVILESWLLFFYIVGSLLNPNAISIFTVGITLLVVFGAVFIPQISKIPFWVILIIPFVALALAQYWSGNLTGDLTIFLPIIAFIAIVITTILSHWVGSALNDFEHAVATIPHEMSQKMPDSGLMGEGLIYREVRRARNHQRPMAFLSIGIDKKSMEAVPESDGQEFHRAIALRVKLQGLSKMLCDELEDCAVIVQDADRFLAVLPETSPEELPFVVERLRQKACDQVKVEIKIGEATLPHDSYTFDGLLEHATQQMEKDREPLPCDEMKPCPVERQISL